jgi:hypothetical protein
LPSCLEPATRYAGIRSRVCVLPQTIFWKISAEVDRFSRFKVSRATHFPASRAAAGLLLWLTLPPWPSLQLQSLPKRSFLMTLQEVGRELGIACHGVVPGIGRQVSQQIGIVAEPLVGNAAARDRAGRRNYGGSGDEELTAVQHTSSIRRRGFHRRVTHQ